MKKTFAYAKIAIAAMTGHTKGYATGTYEWHD